MIVRCCEFDPSLLYFIMAHYGTENRIRVSVEYLLLLFIIKFYSGILKTINCTSESNKHLKKS